MLRFIKAVWRVPRSVFNVWVLTVLWVPFAWSAGYTGKGGGAPPLDGTSIVAISVGAAVLFALSLVPFLGKFVDLCADTFCVLVLPLLALLLNALLGDCSDCSGGRPLGTPDIYGFALVYSGGALAWVFCRLLSQIFHPLVEAVLDCFLLAAMLICVTLQLQLLPYVFFVVVPILGPFSVAPGLAGGFLGAVWLRRGMARLRRYPEIGTWISDPNQRHLATAVPGLVKLAAGIPLGLGLLVTWATIQRLVFNRWPIAALTEVCLGTFATQTAPDCGSHYLCTVAARGHGWLVRPVRAGIRRGQPIVVNRQLMIANAFEELLHDRWPRFGAAARRAYDRCGFPVSRWIRTRWLADLVYLTMKPAEWCFLLTLLTLDGGAAEARIQRQYLG